MPMHNLNTLLNATAPYDAIIEHDVVIAWHELRQRAAAWRHALESRPEKNWALYCKNTADFIAALLGAWGAHKTIYLPSDTLPTTVDSLLPLVDGFLGDFPAAQISTPTVCFDYEHWDIPSDLSTVFFTSGSTGQPKPIDKTIAQLLAEVTTLTEQFGDLLHDVAVYATVSHQHFYGFIFRLMLPLLNQQTIAAQMIQYPENLLSLPSQAYILISSPAFLSRVNAHPEWSKLHPSLKAVFSAGGVLKPEFSEHIKQDWACRPIEIYGSTEAGATAFRQEVQTFKPLPNVQVQLNTDGLLCINSPYCPSFETSDRAHILPNGDFTLNGRADRLIKIEEKRISLTQIEQILSSSAYITQVHVLPLPSEQRTFLGVVASLTDDGQRTLALQGRRIFINEFKQTLGKTIERLAIPRCWRFIDQMPINAQGKTEFNTLTTLLQNPTNVHFPTILAREVSANEAQLNLLIPIDLIYFQGHFTDQAILPGVVQVEWATHYARLHFGDLGSITQIKQLKFQHIITPQKEVILKLSHNADKNTVQFSYSSDEAQYSSGILIGTHHV